MLLRKLDYRIAWLAAILWMAFIFYLSSKPSLPVPGLFPGQDKLMHFISYGVLGLFIGRGLARGAAGITSRQVVIVVLLVLAYGVSDEFHQSFVPGRDASVGDLLADTFGGLVAAWLMRVRSL